MSDHLVRWRYKQLEANTANMGGLLAKVNEAAGDGWELVELAFADKTLGMNSIHAIVRKALDHPADPEDTSVGWKPDPLADAEHRFWNGHVWTVHVRDICAPLPALRGRANLRPACVLGHPRHS